MPVSWNSTFETLPLASESPTQGDDRIRNLKEAVRERLELEHRLDPTGIATAGGAAGQGWHLEGSAVAYYEASAPTLRPDSSTALDSNDAGRIWVDSDTNIMRIRDASGWVGVSRENRAVSLQGILAVGDDLVPPIIFPQPITINKVSARVGTAPTGANLIIDVRHFTAAGADQGTIFSSSFTITAATNSATTTSFAITTLAADDYLVLDIDQIGATVAGSDLAINLDVTLG